MKVTIKKLSVLKHPEKNVRIHSEQQIRELKRSLEKFGQTRALVIDENNIILIGNGLYEATVISLLQYLLLQHRRTANIFTRV